MSDARSLPTCACPGAVRRTDLLDRLADARHARVVLLAAGAGFGKTTLLAQWAEADDRPFAWVALAERDNDPAELAGDLARALLAAGLCAGPGVLVLDGLEALRTRGCLALVAALVDRLGPGCQVAIASRVEPDLPLARWSVEGRLLRLGPDQLALSRSETRALLGTELATADVDELHRRTEGWAAGLRIARLSAPGGTDRLLEDYLRDEVLAALGVEARRFLTRASVLERLNGPLCDAVLGRRRSAAMLRAIARVNLFVTELDGRAGWYRCHPLLGAVLRAELALDGTAEMADLHRRASRWHETWGDPEQAIRHARAAGELDRAADLVWAALPDRLSHGRLASVAGWLAGFAEGAVAACPRLAVAAAWTALDGGDLAASRRWAALAEGAGPPAAQSAGPASPAAAAAILRALCGRDGPGRMAEDAAAGRAGVDPGSGWRALCDVLEGVAHRLADDPRGARACLVRAERVAVAGSAPVPLAWALGQLAILEAEADDPEEAARSAARARTVCEAEGLQGDPCSIGAWAVSALLRAQLGLVADATADTRRCLRLLTAPSPHVPVWLRVDARILLARAGLLVGDASESRARLQEARRELTRIPDGCGLGRRLEEAWRAAQAFPLAGVIAPAPLSGAELRVLRLLPTHLSYREIGERLSVSRFTVKSQAMSAYRKLDVSSRSQAVERAGVLGLIPAADSPELTPHGGANHDRQ